MRVRTWFAGLRRNQRGAALIETALLVPMFATMVIGMVQLGQAFSIKLQLEQASQRAIEKIMNGQADKSSAAALKTEAATIAGVPETSTNPKVDFWHECAGARQTNYADVCNAGQVDKRYMSVSIDKPFTPMFSSKLAGANADGSYTLNGFTVVRTQ